jgi:hypothetical protein
MHINPLALVVVFVGVLLRLVVARNDMTTQRRFFWSGFLIAAVAGFFVPAPPNWRTGAMFAAFVVFVILVNTYMTSPMIKIRGKIYAYHVYDSLPDDSRDSTLASDVDRADYDPAPDSYGGSASARKSWWLYVIAVAFAVLGVLVRGDDKPPWLTPVMAAVLVALPIFFGYFADGSWGYPIARGQYLQFAIIGVITAGVYTVLYIAAYHAGRRWPVRRKQSMEYRVHPRHQKE